MKPQKNHVIPLTILIFSAWTLINTISQLSDVYSFLSVIIGVTGVALYYQNNKHYDKLFYAWVYLQIPSITYAELNVMNSFPLSFGLGMGLGLKNNNTLSLYVNLLPIGIYYLIKYYNVDKPIHSTLLINRLRKGSFSQISFPVKGTIEKRSGRRKMTGIYLITLNSPITIKDKSYNYLMLEPKNHSLIDLHNQWQVCGLRLCENPDLAYTDRFNPFIDWVTIQVQDK